MFGIINIIKLMQNTASSIFKFEGSCFNVC